MKRIFFLIGFLLILFSMQSCTCKCMHCPGSSQYTGAPTDDICKTGYDVSTAAATMPWQTYSDNLLSMGQCTCLQW